MAIIRNITKNNIQKDNSTAFVRYKKG